MEAGEGLQVASQRIRRDGASQLAEDGAVVSDGDLRGVGSRVVEALHHLLRIGWRAGHVDDGLGARERGQTERSDECPYPHRTGMCGKIPPAENGASGKHVDVTAEKWDGLDERG